MAVSTIFHPFKPQYLPGYRHPQPPSFLPSFLPSSSSTAETGLKIFHPRSANLSSPTRCVKRTWWRRVYECRFEYFSSSSSSSSSSRSRFGNYANLTRRRNPCGGIHPPDDSFPDPPAFLFSRHPLLPATPFAIFPPIGSRRLVYAFFFLFVNWKRDFKLVRV